MNIAWYAYLGWIVAAGLMGFAISFVFAGILRLPRSLYLIPYVGLSGLFLYAFIRWSGIPFADLIRHHWVWGLVGKSCSPYSRSKMFFHSRSHQQQKDLLWSLTSSGWA